MNPQELEQAKLNAVTTYLKGLIGEKDMQIGILVGERDYWQGVAQRLQAEAQQTTPEPDTTEPGA